MIKIVNRIEEPSKIETVEQAANKYLLYRFILYKEGKKYQIVRKSEFVYQLMYYRTNELISGSESGGTIISALKSYIDLDYEVYINDKDL